MTKGKESERMAHRDWLKRRAERGSYADIVTELAAEDLPSFKHYRRKDFNSFHRLVEVISPRIVQKNTRLRSPISPSERLALTLRFLAAGETFRSLEFQFRVSRTAISYIVLPFFWAWPASISSQSAILIVVSTLAVGREPFFNERATLETNQHCFHRG